MRMSQVRILYGPPMKVPSVQVQFDKPQKYIVVSVSIDGELKDVLWGNPDAQWHKDIFDSMIAADLQVNEVYGGGRLSANSEAKEIYIWGTSDRFGPASRFLVEEMLGAEFPDYVLKFNQEPNV